MQSRHNAANMLALSRDRPCHSQLLLWPRGIAKCPLSVYFRISVEYSTEVHIWMRGLLNIRWSSAARKCILFLSFNWGSKEREGCVHQSISYASNWPIPIPVMLLQPCQIPVLTNCAFIVVLSMVLKAQTCVYWSRSEWAEASQNGTRNEHNQSISQCF